MSMARPRKENADYFSHDCNMRSHRKIIALRGKYGLVGYAVYNMLLEHIAGCDYFIAKRNVLEKEIIAGDFGVTVAEIDDIVSYCHRLDLVQIDGETLKCRSMIERLSELIDKRNRSRKVVSVAETRSNVPKTIVSAKKNPHSKVNKTKVNKITGTEEEIKKLIKELFTIDEIESSPYKFKTLVEFILMGREVGDTVECVNKKLSTIESKCIAMGCVNGLDGVDWNRAYKTAITMRLRCEENNETTVKFMSRFGKFLSTSK